MFDTSKNIKRIVGISAAALCMLSSIRIAPITVQETEAAGDTMTAFEITEDMGLGWNLGNSFDAYNGNLDIMGVEAETCWGNPKTTNEMLDAVKAKGFNTIRVPVTWYQHVDKNNGYKIDEAWLARVKEVVDYCYNNDMYVILNMHHEEKYQNRSTLGADYQEISGFVCAVWTQLADTFKDYDQHLIFETMNEPRATGTDHEWWGPHDDEVDTINKINADALAVIRKAGGNNDTRLVMMPGYCASSDPAIMSKVIIPDDDYVAASVHAYTPYNFTMNKEIEDHSTFTAAYKNELESCLDGIRKTFSEKDIPVVIGEFSSSNFGNQEARISWAEAYASTSKAYGFPCVLWDNNVEISTDGEAHGYLDRSSCTWYSASEPVLDKFIEVLADDSIVWGSKRKPPVLIHDDLSTGKEVFKGPKEIFVSSEDGTNCLSIANVGWSMINEHDIAMKYTGDTPVLAVVNEEWQGWTEILPYDDKDGIAYFSYEHIKNAWTGDPSEITHIFARTNKTTTIESVVIIGAGEAVDPPEDNTKKFDLDLSARNNDGVLMTKLVVTFTGAAGSTIEGCIGYMGDEWTNIEYKGNIGEDGTFVVEVALGDGENAIPDGITSAQAQIWWCDDEHGTMSDYKLEGKSVTPPDGVDYGDANCNGEIRLNDAVLIMQAIGNPEVYGVNGSDPTHITERGIINGDCYNAGDGLTNKDALAVQMLLINLVDSLPVKE